MLHTSPGLTCALETSTAQICIKHEGPLLGVPPSTSSWKGSNLPQLPAMADQVDEAESWLDTMVQEAAATENDVYGHGL